RSAAGGPESGSTPRCGRSRCHQGFGPELLDERPTIMREPDHRHHGVAVNVVGGKTHPGLEPVLVVHLLTEPLHVAVADVELFLGRGEKPDVFSGDLECDVPVEMPRLQRAEIASSLEPTRTVPGEVHTPVGFAE